MAKIKIATRDAPDPSGNPVDIYPEIRFVRAIVFDNSQDRSPASFLPRIVNVLLRIRASRNKRLRDRDFPVWAGRSINRHGIKLVSVSLPDPIDYQILKLFFAEFLADETYLESGAYLLRDTGGEPIARYLRGKIIVYSDALSVSEVTSALLEEYPGVVECRSWERSQIRKQSSPYATAETLEHISPPFHDIGVWSANHTAILEFLTSLKAGCGYKQLSTIAWNNFGIAVHEESSPEFFKFGCIRLGWLQKDRTATVRILINKNLNDKLKYIVLAHELSHYCLHFEILLMGQIVEEAAWFDPQVELFYQFLLDKYPDLLSKVELDANELATFFLLPPWMYPMNKLSRVILEGGQSPSPEELIWRFLQPLFPDTEMIEYSWVNWQDMKQKMLAETTLNQQDNSSLYGSLLNAALRRERKQMVRKEVEELLNTLFGEFVMSFLAANQVGLGRLPESFADDDKVSRLSEWSLNATSFLREIVPPLNFAGPHPYFPKIPLIPASYNPQGRSDEDWWYLLRGSDSPAGTITEWLNHKEGYGLVLYRYESWQQNILQRV